MFQPYTERKKFTQPYRLRIVHWPGWIKDWVTWGGFFLYDRPIHGRR